MPAPGHGRPGDGSESRRHEFVDLYELLEISPHASQDVIQAAYRTLARKYHPDVNTSSDATCRIRQLNQAYSILSDPANRAGYDLECSRAHRHERLTDPEYVIAGHTSSRSAQPHPLQLPPIRPRVPVQERLPLLSGQAILGLFVVAALAAFVLLVLWANLDASTETSMSYVGPKVEFSSTR